MALNSENAPIELQSNIWLVWPPLFGRSVRRFVKVKGNNPLILGNIQKCTTLRFQNKHLQTFGWAIHYFCCTLEDQYNTRKIHDRRLVNFWDLDPQKNPSSRTWEKYEKILDRFVSKRLQRSQRSRLWKGCNVHLSIKNVCQDSNHTAVRCTRIRKGNVDTSKKFSGVTTTWG